MNRYYFDLHESGCIVEDGEGRECISLDAALAYALESARDVIAADARSSLSPFIAIRTTSQDVYRLDFADAVCIKGAGVGRSAAA